MAVIQSDLPDALAARMKARTWPCGDYGAFFRLDGPDDNDLLAGTSPRSPENHSEPSLLMPKNASPLEQIVAGLNQLFDSDARIADDGVIHLQFDGEELNVAIAVSPDALDLVLYSHIASINGGKGLALMTAALTLNLHQVATRGGSIGLDSENQVLIFSWRMSLEGSELAQWLSALDQFCSTSRELIAQMRFAMDDFSDEELCAIERRASGSSDLDEAEALESIDRDQDEASAADPFARRGLPPAMIRG